MNKRKIIKILFSLIITIFFLFCISPFISLFSSNKYRTRVYIDLTYKVIADRETKGLISEEAIILKLFDYAHKHIFVPRNAAPWDANLLDYLVTGIGWCDHQANVFNMLLSKKGIPARYVYLKDKDGISPHTVSEVYFNHKWIVFDPQNELYFKLNNGEYATLNDISEDPKIIFNHIKFKNLEAIDKNAYELSKGFWQRVIPLRMEPERSVPWTRRNNIFVKILDLYVDCFGKAFVNAYQDIYLKIRLRSIKEMDYKLFFSARNYQLYHRRDLAINKYMSLFNNFPNSKYCDDSLFFLGLLYIDIDNNYKMAKKVFNKLNIDYPDNKWSSIAKINIQECDTKLAKEQKSNISFP